MDRLYYPELLSETGNPSPHAVAWLRQRFLRIFEPRKSLHEAPGLYTNGNGAARRIVNEEEIVEHLQREGFEVICPGDFPFIEQIRIFQDVEIVVAAHGAGCTNMVFAPQGAILVELFGNNYINGCFWALANICDRSMPS